MNKEYIMKQANLLGVPVEASKKEIDRAYTIWYMNWDKKEMHTSQDYDKLANMRNARDIMFKYIELKERNKPKNSSSVKSSSPIKSSSPVKVTHQEEAPKKTVDVGNKILAGLSIGALLSVIGAYTLKGVDFSKSTESSNSVVSSENTNNNEENNNVIIDDPRINDDAFMKNLATIEWEKIAKIKNYDPKFAPTVYNEDVVYELIRWAHHSDPNYTGEYTLSNEDASARLFELVGSHYDITNLFKGLTCYENVNSLGSKIAMMDSENTSYYDEYDAYMTIKQSLDNMNSNNYAEVIVLRVICKYMISDINNYGMRDIAYDKSNLDTTKVTECKEIFNKINDDSIFISILQNAKLEDKNKGLVLKR